MYLYILLAIIIVLLLVIAGRLSEVVSGLSAVAGEIEQLHEDMRKSWLEEYGRPEVLPWEED